MKDVRHRFGVTQREKRVKAATTGADAIVEYDASEEKEQNFKFIIVNCLNLFFISLHHVFFCVCLV